MTRRSAEETGVAYYEALGRAIKVARTQRDIGRRELAERAGVSYAFLADIETGRGHPSPKSLVAIAHALGLSPSELMQEAEAYGAMAETGSWGAPESSTGRWFHSGSEPRAMSADSVPPPRTRVDLQHMARNRLAEQTSTERSELHAAVDALSDEDMNTVLALARRLLRR